MKCYTYLWLREDGTPYYVGKGTGDRAFFKRNHLQRPPKDKDLILIQEFPDEVSAFEAEKLLIACYGRIDLGTGCLRNMTDGGDGPSAPSMETRSKLAFAARRENRSPETLEKMAVAKRGRKLGPATIAKIRFNSSRQNLSMETRAKLSKASKALWGRRSEESIAKMGAASRLPEARAKISAAHKGRKHSAETRTKLSIISRKENLSQETLEKRSAALKGRVFSPEWRAKMSAAALARHARKAAA